ncbi:manganese efflux pump MntP [Lederbergia lenta]|nr:manganese efflux pump [Lederbergia lenta]MCM3112064.1 manganese efflux pump MntP family protein [Lederbergia lenta]MEC2323234.1 manganese efflux pump [Lederbergia lenta]
MAFAIAMDAFSVALGIGTYKLRIRQIFYIGLTVGLFHMILPLVGIFAGHLLSETFGQISAYVGGALLICIGLQMVIACFLNGKSSVPLPVGWGLLLFSLIISLDSFSAGLSLGMFGVRAAATVICFGIVATFLTWSGLVIGRKFQNLLGVYGELLGGFILVIFGLKLLLPL